MPQAGSNRFLGVGRNPAPNIQRSASLTNVPGNWGPLLGKTVRIVTVLKAVNDAEVTGPEAKLHTRNRC